MNSRRRFIRSSLLSGIPFLVSSNTLFVENILANNSPAMTWEQVKPGTLISFPGDYGSHPSFRLEWWYLTGWLNSISSSYGFQVTFFRFGTEYRSKRNLSFDSSQIIFVHCSISDPDRNRLLTTQKIGRQGIGPVTVEEGDLLLQFEGILFFRKKQVDEYVVKINERDFNLDLIVIPPALSGSNYPPVLNGDNGFSQKAPDKKFASYYYSRPNLSITGNLGLNQKSKVSGIGWLDHEWTSELLRDDFVGWDWIGINLIDGSSLMIFKVRRKDGSIGWTDYSFFDKSQNKKPIYEFNKIFNNQEPDKLKTTDEISWRPIKTWRSSRSGAVYPISQSIFINEVEYGIIPLMNNQEIDATQSTGNYYWEGAVSMTSGELKIGIGYLELTGYTAPLLIGN